MSTAPILPTAPPPQDTTNAPDISAAPSGSMQPPISTDQAPPSVSNLDRSSLPGGDPNAQAQAARTRPATAAAAQQAAAAQMTPRTGAKGVLGDIFETLAGGKKKEWVQTDQGPVATYRDLQPGEMARGILAAAITGLAGGYDAENRGKGPALSDAFSGGFKANEKRVEKQQAGEANEAQEQFKNEGISEERALRLHQDAREQMKSIADATKDYQEGREREVRIAGMDWRLGEDKRVAHEVAQAKWTDLTRDANNIVKNPNSENGMFASETAARDFANKNPDKAGLYKFDTVMAKNPQTGEYAIVRKPWNYDTPQWLGVKLDPKTHTPVMKNGEMQIDPQHPYLDINGKPSIPTGQLSMRDFDASNEKHYKDAADEKIKNLTAQEAQARLDETRLKLGEDKAVVLAKKHMAEANGDLTALNDDKSGPRVTYEDLQHLEREFGSEATQVKGVYQTAAADLQKLEAAGIPVNDPRTVQAQNIKDQAAQEMQQLSAYQISLQGGRKTDDLLENAIRQDQNITDVKTGKVDVDKAKTFLSKVDPTVRDRILTKVSKPAEVPVPPALRPTVDAFDKMDPDKRKQFITQADPSKYPAGVLSFLSERYGLPAPAEAPKPESVTKMIQGAAYKLAIPGVPNPNPEPTK